MVDKAELSKHLARYDVELPKFQANNGMQMLKESSSFVPTTFLLNDPKDRKAFEVEITGSNVGRSTHQPWILKRADLSNGEGARILPNPLEWIQGNDYMNWFAQLGGSQRGLAKIGAPVSSVAPDRWLVQRLIDKPLLLNGRKSELRCYWLVASLEPLVVLYNTGTVRLNAAPYTEADYTNDLVHITNTRRQLAHPSINASAAANHGQNLKLKWPHSQVEIRYPAVHFQCCFVLHV